MHSEWVSVPHFMQIEGLTSKKPVCKEAYEYLTGLDYFKISKQNPSFKAQDPQKRCFGNHTQAVNHHSYGLLKKRHELHREFDTLECRDWDKVLEFSKYEFLVLRDAYLTRELLEVGVLEKRIDELRNTLKEHKKDCTYCN